jgi:hypothetical protein
MTDIRFEIPAGFTSADQGPANATCSDRFEVLYKPYGTQTHFESGVAKYDRECRNPAYRWKTTDNDNVGDSGRTVVAWRRQKDEMKIVRLAPAPAIAEDDGLDGYDQAIRLLAAEHLKLDLDGAQDSRPSGVGLTAALFRVDASKVVDDYKRVAKELYAADRR